MKLLLLILLTANSTTAAVDNHDAQSLLSSPTCDFLILNNGDQVNRSAKDLLNVPLLDFDDLRLICVEDQATGSYGKSVGDILLESINVFDDTSETQGMSVGTQSNSGREAFSRIDGLTEQVTKLTEVVVSSDQLADQNFCDKVYGELLASEDEEFDDDFLTKAFEYLTSHSLSDRQFLAKRHTSRLKWLKDFAARNI